MANLILLNVSKKIIGSVGIMNEIQKSNNTFVYNPTEQFALDILDLATPIRSNPDGSTYFGTRSSKLQAIENRNVGLDYWVCTDSINTLASQSQDIILLTVVKKGFLTINNEIMAFQTAKIIEVASVDGATGNTRFQYLEDGQANQVTYEVTQTPAQMVASGVSPVFNSNGYELYVNDIHGNNATAEFGNPLLPWATFDAAFTAAVAHATPANIIVTGGTQTASNNFFSGGINVEIKSDAVLIVSTYTATGSGSQIICGKGTLVLNGTMSAGAAFSGALTVSVGTVSAQSTTGFSNASTSNGVINVICDYSVMGTACKYLYSVTGTTNEGSFKTNIKHTDASTGANMVSTFFINPSALVAGQKYFNFYMASGNSNSSNEGMLCIANTDGTYIVNADFTILYNGGAGTPGLNSVLTCVNTTSTIINLKGTNYITTGGGCSLILNSNAIVNDYSKTYSVDANPDSLVVLSGGNSVYTYFDKKLSKSTNANGSVNLGFFYTSGVSVDFGAVAATAGTDTLHFKGALKATYANNAAIGIFVDNGNSNLVIDGGIIEMVNSNTANDAISASAPQNIKVFGTGYVRGAVNGNITNTITGTNIIQDAGIVACI